MPVFIIILFATFLLGFSAALFAPLLSLYFTQEIGISAFWLSFYFVTSIIAGVLISQVLASYSDKGLSRARIVQFASLAAALNTLAFARLDEFWALWLVAMTLTAFSQAALPQLFAMAREAVSGDNAPLLLSVQRATISLAWIAGPPIAFYLSDLLGFRTLMLAACVAYLLVTALSLFLPSNSTTTAAKKDKASAHISSAMKLLIVAFVAIFAANNLYIIGMPLYITDTLDWPQWISGVLMGLAAALEIPVMILSGVLVRRYGVHNQTVLAVFLGVLYYFGFGLADEFWHMLVLQALNGVLVGVTAGIGITYFQQMMPDFLGTASTLYNNSIKVGGGIGSALIGVTVFFGGYQNVFWFAAVLMAVALVVMIMLTRNIKLASQQVPAKA